MALKKFKIDKANGKFLGVCAGLGNYFGIDGTFVRIGMVVLTLVGGFPWTLIAYGIAAWAAKPAGSGGYGLDGARQPRTSTYDLHNSMRDIDRRMAEVEHYVTSSNNSLASEIEKLR